LADLKDGFDAGGFGEGFHDGNVPLEPMDHHEIT
jgi:hypothetical protein